MLPESPTSPSHLRRGSIAVERGASVTAGQRLGLVGLSGNTEFPHVEFSLRFRGKPLDPFVGLGEAEGCGPGEGALWRPEVLAKLAYRRSGLLGAGFAAEVPTAYAARRGAYLGERLTPKSAALVFWVDVFGLLPGDEEHFRIIAPDGSRLTETRKRRPGRLAQRFGFVGKRRKAEAWPAGVYRGEYRLLRKVDGQVRTALSVAREVVVE